MPLGLVSFKQGAHLRVQRFVHAAKPFGQVLVDRAFGNAEFFRRGADGAVVFQYVHCQLAGTLVYACEQSDHSPCAARAARLLEHVYERRRAYM